MRRGGFTLVGVLAGLSLLAMVTALACSLFGGPFKAARLSRNVDKFSGTG